MTIRNFVGQLIGNLLRQVINHVVETLYSCYFEKILIDKIDSKLGYAVIPTVKRTIGF